MYDVLRATGRECLYLAKMQNRKCMYIFALGAACHRTCALVLFRTAGLAYHYANMLACKLRMMNRFMVRDYVCVFWGNCKVLSGVRAGAFLELRLPF